MLLQPFLLLIFIKNADMKNLSTKVELGAPKIVIFWNIIKFKNEEVDSLWNWTLSKIHIIFKNASNKSCWVLNSIQKRQWVRKSISPQSGVRGFQRLPYFCGIRNRDTYATDMDLHSWLLTDEPTSKPNKMTYRLSQFKQKKEERLNCTATWAPGNKGGREWKITNQQPPRPMVGPCTPNQKGWHRHPKTKHPKTWRISKNDVSLIPYSTTTFHSLVHLTRDPKGRRAIKDPTVGKIRKGQRKLRNG